MKARFLMLLLFAPMGWAQSAPDMASAPHYRQLVVNDQVRVFALTLKPLERTMARHDHNFLAITLLDCDVVMWPEGEADARSACAMTAPRNIAMSPSNFSIRK
jgi:hypothetical protein